MKLQHLSLLAILIGLAVFPFGWLTYFSPLASTIGQIFFPHELAHNIGHALLFASLGIALLVLLPVTRQRPTIYFVIILLIGMGQEGFQLLYKQRGVVFNDLSDLLIDLTAAALVYGLWYSGTTWRQRRQGSDYAQVTRSRR